MKTYLKSRRTCAKQRSKVVHATALMALILSGCATSDSSFLYPNGLIAVLQRRWFLEVGAILIVVLLPIFTILPAILWRYRASDRKARYTPEWHHYLPLEIFIWGGPCVIVAGIALLIAGPQVRYSPENPISSSPALHIQAVGMDWKWLFIYPDQHLATLNTLYLPAQSNIVFSLSSTGTMQSFFIPAISGQLYAMGGMVTRLNLRTGAPGDFLGENTQFNGMGFQAQKFCVHVVSAEAFGQWIGRSLSTAPTLSENILRTLRRPGTIQDAREALEGAIDVSDATSGGGIVFRQDHEIFTQIVHEARSGRP